MKKLEDDIFLKPFTLFSIALSCIVFLGFILIKSFLEKLIVTSKLDYSVVMQDFYILWGFVSIFATILLILLYKILQKKQTHIVEDVTSLSKYLHQISVDKKYDASIEIKHYFEFLYISVVLKNIVKRLNIKAKKK